MRPVTDLHLPPTIAACLALSLFVAPVAHSIEAGAKLPDCRLQQLSGAGQVALARPGRVVYVDFWASWCGPCKLSMPFMNQLHAEYAAQGLDVVAINLDEERGDAETFLQENPVGITIARNDDGQCPASFGVQAMPSSYLIDKHGQVRYVNLGFHDAETATLKQRIHSLLQEN